MLCRYYLCDINLGLLVGIRSLKYRKNEIFYFRYFCVVGGITCIANVKLHKICIQLIYTYCYFSFLTLCASLLVRDVSENFVYVALYKY